MASDFRQDLTGDLDDNFLNTREFGEEVTLTRGGLSVTMPGLFDAQSLDGEQLGVDIEAIAHRPRLFVKSADLPDNKPRKGDIFAISASEFHPALQMKGVDFAFEKDGTVVYKLVDAKASP